jgi:hypothetical protein
MIVDMIFNRDNDFQKELKADKIYQFLQNMPPDQIKKYVDEKILSISEVKELLISIILNLQSLNTRIGK